MLKYMPVTRQTSGTGGWPAVCGAARYHSSVPPTSRACAWSLFAMRAWLVLVARWNTVARTGAIALGSTRRIAVSWKAVRGAR